jgi:hypothetical protein
MEVAIKIISSMKKRLLSFCGTFRYYKCKSMRIDRVFFPSSKENSLKKGG